MMIAIKATKMPFRIHNSLLFIPVPRFCHYYLDSVVVYASEAFLVTISRKSRLEMANTGTQLRNLFFLPLCFHRHQLAWQQPPEPGQWWVLRKDVLSTSSSQSVFTMGSEAVTWPQSRPCALASDTVLLALIKHPFFPPSGAVPARAGELCLLIVTFSSM